MNGIWIFFILGSVGVALIRVLLGDTQVATQCMQALTGAFGLSLQTAWIMLGVMGFWLGLFKIAEKSGITQKVAQGLAPLLVRLMPDVPRNHWVMGAISMNLSANFLGLDNAATPFGLKAMQGLQELNPYPDRVSRAQVMFLMLNCNALCWLPVSILAYRVQAGSMQPGLVYVPILFSSTIGLLLAISLTMFLQKIRPDVRLLSVVGVVLAVIAIWAARIMQTPASLRSGLLQTGDILVLLIIGFIVLWGACRVKDVYTPFIEGAKQAFALTLEIFPYVLAMLCALALFRASGLQSYLLNFLSAVGVHVGLRTEWLPALPAALMKPFSASAARGWLIDLMHHQGVDSFAALVAAVIQGSTETTLYVMNVYLGSVGIKRTGYVLGLGLFSEFMGICVAVLISYAFFSVR